jgi:hypothetical protein
LGTADFWIVDRRLRFSSDDWGSPIGLTIGDLGLNPHPKSAIRISNPQTAIRNPQTAFRNPQSQSQIATLNPQSAIRKIGIPQSAIRNRVK